MMLINSIEVPEDIILFKVPRKFRPGTDLLSKLIVKQLSTVDAVTKSVLGVPDGTYMTSGTAFVDGSECDILYVPRLATNNSLPPVILEVQNIVSRNFMLRVIRYCLNVYQFWNKLPVLVIICINKVSPKELEDTFTPKENTKYPLETPCLHWAESCFLLTRKVLTPISMSRSKNLWIFSWH